jgi:hypothetical protein
MLTRDGEKERYHADRHYKGRRIDNTDRERQIVEGVLEESLQLKAEKNLYAEHLHSQFIERGFQRGFKR